MKISNEAKIGIMLVTVLLLLAFLTIKSGDFNFSSKGYTVKVMFNNIDGVNLNAPVMINGLEVGKVEDIRIIEDVNETKLELTVWLRESAKLTVGTKAYVKNMGFLGEKYVGLAVAGTADGYLTEGAVIEGREPADMDTILADGQEIARQIREISENMNERLNRNRESIDRILGNLDSSTANIKSITTNIDERLSVNQYKIDDAMSNLHSASTNLDQFTYDLKQNPWKLLYRSKEKRKRSIEKLEEKKAE